MSDANLKNRLRKRLKNHSTPMDLELEWAALAARRPSKKKRPFIWFWFGLAALIIVFFIWYNTKTDHVSLPYASATKQDSVPLDSQPMVPFSVAKDLKENTQTVRELPSANLSNTLLDRPKGAKEITQKFQVEELYHDQITRMVAIEKEANEKEINMDVSKKITNSTNPSGDQISGEAPKIGLNRLAPVVSKNATTLLLDHLPMLTALNTNAKEIIKKESAIWALGINVAYGKTFRRLDALNQSTNLLVDRRNEFETALENWNLSLNVSRMINQNWFAEFGLGYSQTTDRFQDTNTLIYTHPLDNQVVSVTYKNDGTVDTTLGEVMAETTLITKGTYYHYSKNAFAQIILGRKISFSNRFGSSLSAGLNYSLLTHKSGTMFSNTSANVYDDLSKSNYRKNGLINALVRAEINYLMTKNWEISLGLQASYSLNNAFQTNSGFLEKRNVAALQIGLKKWF